MQKSDWIILYLSLSLLVVQVLWVRDIRQAEYQRGRSEILEIMAELTDRPNLYVAPKKDGKHVPTR